MNNEFEKIWHLAKPYYEKGRPMDIDHIESMMVDAIKLCDAEKIDKSMLLPLAILHDVGYANVSKENPFNLNLRRAHMEEGKLISEEILVKLNYPKDTIDKISHYVSIHDNWAFGENEIYNNDKILGSFNDLDFMWMATEEGFPALKKVLNKSSLEMIEYLQNNEKLKSRPFATDFAKKLFEFYINQRLKEI